MRLTDVLWLAIIITLATMIGLYLSGYGNCCDLTKIGAAAQPAVPECVTDEDRVHIRATALAAVDEGLKDHIKLLFAGWIKDPSHQPERASAGIQAAIVAYQHARADVLRWAPVSC